MIYAIDFTMSRLIADNTNIIKPNVLSWFTGTIINYINLTGCFFFNRRVQSSYYYKIKLDIRQPTADRSDPTKSMIVKHLPITFYTQNYQAIKKKRWNCLFQTSICFNDQQVHSFNRNFVISFLHMLDNLLLATRSQNLCTNQVVGEWLYICTLLPICSIFLFFPHPFLLNKLSFINDRLTCDLYFCDHGSVKLSCYFVSWHNHSVFFYTYRIAYVIIG